MSEILNCPNCGSIYVKNQFREVCDACFRTEEKKFEEVSKFLRVRENRSALPEMIIEKTGVDEALLHKWVRKGRLNVRHFPNLGYPCERCGKLIKEGKLCGDCAGEITKDLQIFNEEQERMKKQQERRTETYRTINREQ
ncbi:TIGR03826 family flagellar region protein [Bacillus sp. 2205SS5-2]|uniref:TIGR03826 family flagellar region protein n=1 Tax=Bacillus sp. 2205SS5-2 TaxID=3109031 RepID=UPI003003B827